MARVLVACEYSARVRDAFRARGHDAWSCDLLPTDGDPNYHMIGDAISITWGHNWDCLIAFPPCTDLSVICAKDWKKKWEDGRQPRALGFVKALMNAPIPHIAIENPVGKINTAIRKPDQIIHPWQHGDPWDKRTCLWLKGLPVLLPDEIVKSNGFWVSGKSLGKGRDRKQEGAYLAARAAGTSGSWQDLKHYRSATFPGIARAMADQWGSYLDSLSMPLAA